MNLPSITSIEDSVLVFQKTKDDQRNYDLRSLTFSNKRKNLYELILKTIFNRPC